VFFLLVFIVVGITVLVTLLWVRAIMQKHRAAEYAVTSEEGIERLVKLDIGGADQWLHIRGRHRNNPILLFIHGGPGWSHIGWYDKIQRPWEDYFTVVQWDQRQAGKSYQPLKAIGHTLSHQQYISDAEDVITYLQSEFNQPKIFVMGTSYGTYIGMHIAKRHPDWLHAYIGVGQVVKMKENARAEHKLLLDYAIHHGHDTLAETLKSMEPYPNPEDPAKDIFNQSFFLMEEESKFGKAYPAGLTGLIKSSNIEKWLSPLYTLRDNFNRIKGDEPDADHPFAKEFVEYDLPKELGDQFEVPIFFFTGAEDFHVAYSLSDQWFQQISTTHKEHIWFKHSAHVPFETEPGEFLIALVQRVLPLSNQPTLSAFKESA